MIDGNTNSFRRKLAALRDVADYRPMLTVFIMLFTVAAATFEAVGLGFIIPIIEIV
jgi:subfamily B ATP-binding cassette protein MsbA